MIHDHFSQLDLRSFFWYSIMGTLSPTRGDRGDQKEIQMDRDETILQDEPFCGDKFQKLLLSKEYPLLRRQLMPSWWETFKVFVLRIFP